MKAGGSRRVIKWKSCAFDENIICVYPNAHLHHLRTPGYLPF